MKALNLTFILSFLFLFASSQTPGWQWVQSGGGNGRPGSTPQAPANDEIFASAFDHEGNLIVGGICTWFPEFDTIHFTSSVNWENKNFFLAKYDKCGNVLWARVGGGASDDEISSLDVDERGNIYVYGFLQASGSLAYIKTPLKDTTIANSKVWFGKFDSNGNLLHVKTWNPNVDFTFWPERGMLKRLKNGNLLSVTTAQALTGNIHPIDNYNMVSGSRNFVLFDTLGNVIKGGKIDTIGRYGGALSKFVLDDNENIYFTIPNSSFTSVLILDSFINPAPVLSYYLVKTDTSFKLKKINTSGYRNEACYHMCCSNNFLYTSGRNINGARFDFDTSRSVLANGNFTAYKIDTNLHLIWASQADTQTINAAYTNIRPGASQDYVYLTYQHRGTIRWDSVRLVVPANNFEMAILKMRTSDGVCVEGTFTGGINSSYDQCPIIDIGDNGNPYFIGSFTNSIGTNNDSVLANGGASSPDYFILKWGLSCNDTLNSLDKPETPTSLVATATGTQSINVVWQNTAALRLGFHLYRSPDGVSNWTQISTKAHDEYFHNDNSLQPGTVYWYKVAAYTSGGESPFSNIDSAQAFSGNCAVTITSDKTQLCAGDTAYLCATPGFVSYLWHSGQTDSCISTTFGGNYQVTATDNTGCTAVSNTVALPLYPLPAVSLTVNGDTLSATGGGNYQWHLHGSAIPGATDSVYIVTQNGTYSVVVSEANGCSVQSQTVVVSSFFYATISSTNTLCGDSTGTATANAFLGIAPFQYIWNNGEVIQTITGLAEGVYTVTVTDSTGATALAQVILTASNQVNVVAFSSATTCGANNGTASVTATGGNGNFTYVWSTGEITPFPVNLAPGTYTVTATSGNCTGTASVTVGPSSALPQTTVTASKTLMCPGDTTGICAPVGFASYVWSTSETSRCITVSQAGTYSAIVRDANNCTASSNALTITLYPAPTASITVSGDTLKASAGDSYQWYRDNTVIPGATSNIYIPTQGGSYTVAIADNNGCVATSNAIIITGINDITEEDGVSVYPNPLTVGGWQLTVGSNLIGGEVEVLDANGRVVFHSTLITQHSSLEFSAPAGVYLLRINSEKNSVVKKLVRL